MAASTLPFNNICINGTNYGVSGLTVNANIFVFGSGQISSDKKEITRTLNNGTVNVNVMTVDITGKCELNGDMTVLETDAGDQDEIIVGVKTFYGTVSCEYSTDSLVTSVSFKGKIAAAPEPLEGQAILDGSSGQP